MNVRNAVALVAALLAAAAPLAAAVEPVPAPAGISRFTRHPRFVEAKLSPEGTYLAAISLERGKRTLVVLDLKTRQVASQLEPDSENMPGPFHWASDRRLVVELWRFEGYLDAPVTWGEIYAVDASGKNGKLIFGYRAGEDQVGSRIKKGERVRAHARVLDALRDDDRRILVAYTLWDELDAIPRVEKVDVVTGVRTPVTAAPIPHAWLQTDEDGEVRIAAGMDEQLRWKYFQRDPGGTWRPIAALSGLAAGGYPFGFVARERTLYAVEPDGKGFAVLAIATDSGARRVLARQDMVDPSHFSFDRATGRLVAVEWEPDVPVVDVLDPEHPVSRVLRGLEATYPDEHVRVVSRTDDEQKAVAFVSSDRAPGRFLLVDAAKLSAETLFDVRPWIVPDEMAETSAFHVAASDGVRIHGYVTLPHGPRDRPPPMVVLPHGGPHGIRDHWAFDPEVQLLASEGFAVLRVNYRGSGGYGEAYQEAGYRRWGDRVVQDVVDATRWAVRKGFADPARICAFGGSFGAYASMQAAVLAPDLFRCAVGYAGVYDLTRMSWTGDVPHTRFGRGFVRTAVGADEGALRAASPVHDAEKLRARVLLVHGEEDERAPLAHAEKLRDALAAEGRPPAWLVEPREGHGFYDEGARERMWARVIAFLKESTPAPAAAAAAPPAPVPAKAPAPTGAPPAGR
jgi:dipeptidyl aminopeptidase/acylaminoacyl peptidase